MILELTLMLVSMAAMTGLIVHKRLEPTWGVTAPLRDVREKTDPILRHMHRSTNKVFGYVTIHNGVLLANYVFVHIVRFLMRASSKIHNLSSDIVEKASRHTEDLSRGGAASFYLKKIKEDKDKSIAMAGGKMEK